MEHSNAPVAQSSEYAQPIVWDEQINVVTTSSKYYVQGVVSGFVRLSSLKQNSTLAKEARRWNNITHVAIRQMQCSQLRGKYAYNRYAVCLVTAIDDINLRKLLSITKVRFSQVCIYITQETFVFSAQSIREGTNLTFEQNWCEWCSFAIENCFHHRECSKFCLDSEEAVDECCPYSSSATCAYACSNHCLLQYTEADFNELCREGLE